MFAIDETTAKAIRHTLQESGELAAAVKLRRRFLGVICTEAGRICVLRTVAAGDCSHGGLAAQDRVPVAPVIIPLATAYRRGNAHAF
jgi:hypothetical protein